MLELIYTEGGQRGKAVRLTFEKAWFGRQTTCDFVLQGDDISRVHFCIEHRGQDYVLIDNKSTNGTYVNRVRATVVALRSGDEIVAGSNHMLVRETAAPSRSTFRFVAEFKGADGGSQVVEQETVLLGRKSTCNIQLNDPAVAAVHAQLDHQPDGVWITDESSGSGVYVNGQRAVYQQLRNRDVVIIRPFEIKISLTEEMCLLGIQDCTVASPEPLPKNLPGNYREVVVAPARGRGRPAPLDAG
jgi:pSer/pThr/pTyr-binding forkhead associated (FHA) protein